MVKCFMKKPGMAEMPGIYWFQKLLNKLKIYFPAGECRVLQRDNLRLRPKLFTSPYPN